MAAGQDISDRINAIQTEDIDPDLDYGCIYDPSAVLKFLTGHKLKPKDDQEASKTIASRYATKKFLQQPIIGKTLQGTPRGLAVGGAYPFQDEYEITKATYDWSKYVQAITIPIEEIEDAESNDARVDMLMSTHEEHLSGFGEFLALTALATRNGDPQTIPSTFAGEVGRSDAGRIALNPLDYLIGTLSAGNLTPSTLGAANQFIWESHVNALTTFDIDTFLTIISNVKKGARKPTYVFLNDVAWMQLAKDFGVFLPGVERMGSSEPRFLGFDTFMVGGVTFIADSHVPLDTTTVPGSAIVTCFGVEEKSIAMRFKNGTKSGWQLGSWQKLQESDNYARVNKFKAQIVNVGTRRFHFKSSVQTFPI
jgi:hypothetical protein